MKYALLIFLGSFLMFSCASMKKQKETKKPVVTKPGKITGKKFVETNQANPNILQQTQCGLKKDVRILEIELGIPSGCTVFYTKFGERKELANAKYDTGYCVKVYQNTKKNLMSAGFNCSN